MKSRGIIFSLVLLYFLPGLGALEFWPLKETELRRVFLQTSVNGVFPGVDLAGTSVDVVSPDKGEIVFNSDAGKTRLQKLPSALGSFVMIAHEENLRSVVSQFVPSAFLSSRQTVQAGDRIGSALDPVAPRVRLFVFDHQLSTVVNPQMVLPSLPDSRAPIFFDANLVSEDGKQSFSLVRQNRATNGYWTMLLDVGDPQSSGTGREFLKGIFSVEAFHNGTEFFNSAAESLKSEDGQLFFYESSNQSPKKAREIRSADRIWNLGRIFITEGTNIIEIVISDYAGNESSRTFNLRGGRF